MMIKDSIKVILHKWSRIWHPADLSGIPKQPYSRKMGWERGKPIDRVYIERFLQKHKRYICGTVMEIAEDTYTKMYGKDLQDILIFTADERATSERVIIGDLQSGKGVREGIANCFILTQTLPFIYDIPASCKNIVKMLKRGGTALVTVRGISMISKYDEERWGDYWGFTMRSLRRAFEMDDIEIIDLVQYGNMRTAIGFLCGMVKEDLRDEDFETDDELYPVLLGIAIRKIR